MEYQTAWDKLSISSKAAVMKAAIDNGIYELKDIKAKYNMYAEGGNTKQEELPPITPFRQKAEVIITPDSEYNQYLNTLPDNQRFGMGGDNPFTVGSIVNSLYASNPREEFLGEPSHHYDFTQSDEWADAHGYYPDARGHRDDRVKKPAHPSHPSRGFWNGDTFILSDFGMQNPNYTLFGLNDGGQDPQAILTYQGGVVLPEITVTPKENYIFNPYDNIILHQKSEGGKIHIKPENRGKFTALKERTGHSSTWFKEHGTPAQKKMATFALNSRKWQHPDGGYLPRPVTTGGAGYVPPVSDNSVQQTSNAIMWPLRDFMYRRILPTSSYDIKRNIEGALKGDANYFILKKDDYDLENGYPEDTQYTEISERKAPLSVIDDIYAEYLQIPKNKRRHFIGPKIKESHYSPTVNKDNRKYKYYSLPLTDDAKSRLVEEGTYIPIGTNKISDIFESSSKTVFNLGDHTIGRWYDEKGDYISYYDKFDLNPFTDKYQGTSIPFLKNMEDATFGIGKPVHLYDRIYLDDYYGVPNNKRGGVYLPEVEVYGYEHSNGGPLVNRFDDGGKTYIGGADQELVVTPEQTFRQSITDRDPYVDYQFYSPAGNSIVQTINSTPRWQQYWADQESSRVSNAMHRAAPVVGGLLAAAGAAPLAEGITPLLSAAGEAVYPYASTVLSNPYVDAGLTSAFAAHGLNHALNEGINGWGDAAITALEITPLGRVVKPAVNEAITAAKTIYDNGTLWDAYTTFGGRFGNYGDNIFTDMYGTAARRFGLPDKARVPADAIRKIKEDVYIDNGVVDLVGNKLYLGNPHINATLDRGVVSHSKGAWDGANTYITPTRSFLKQTQGSLKSIEPSDMFSNGARVTESPQNVTLISGDVESLNKAREAGIQTLSSPRLRRLYQKEKAKYLAEKAAFDKQYANASGMQKLLLKVPENPKYKKWWPEYANEVQRLQTQRGTPTLSDFQLLEEQTGLSSGVASVSEMQNAVRQLRDMQNISISDIMSGKVQPYKYPNGRVVDWDKVAEELELINRAKYNKVFYDPASHVESDWLVANGIR